MRLLKIIASCGGIGYIKGGGTLAALLYTILWSFIRPPVSSTVVQCIVFLVITVLAVFVSNQLEAAWGKDSSKIVIDEVAGMGITLLFVPQQWQYALAGLAAFRFFDIVKPLFIKDAEKLPRGWGVMGDDIVAGICANLVLQLVLVANIF